MDQVRYVFVRPVGKSAPLWRHDCSCDKCVFVGWLCRVSPDVACGEETPCIDVYHSCQGSVLIRKSGESSDYHSLPYHLAIQIRDSMWIGACTLVEEGVMAEDGVY